MSGDARGWRIALLPDILVNPPEATRSALPDVLGLVEAGGYGVLQLPPPGEHGALLAVIADQVAEYAHHGYAVAAIGVRWAGERESGRREPRGGERSVGGLRDADPGDDLHWRRLAPLLRHRGVAPLPPRHLIRADADADAEGQRLAAFLSGYDLPVEEQRRWRV